MSIFSLSLIFSQWLAGMAKSTKQQILYFFFINCDERKENAKNEFMPFVQSVIGGGEKRKKRINDY